MSVPDYTGDVDRSTEITLQYTLPEGTIQVITASGFEAVAIQHEMDHLDGVLFLDRVTSIKTGLFRRYGLLRKGAASLHEPRVVARRTGSGVGDPIAFGPVEAGLVRAAAIVAAGIAEKGTGRIGLTA